MIKGIKLIALIGVAATFTGCAAVRSPVGNAMIYTGVKGPVVATSQTTWSKTGSSSCHNILGIVAIGDASITAACQDGDITKVHHVDHNSQNVLGLYSRFETIVSGE
jgi:hypothetical protein